VITCSFEKTLKQKLSQKSNGQQSEEAVLLKAFKYFDLNNNGTVEPDEFAKAVEKIGIMIPTKQDLDSLYSIYDTDKSGVLEYREFASEIFGRDVGGATPSRGKATGEDLLGKLRTKLASRGARGIIGLAKQFRIMDDNHSMSLDKDGSGILDLDDIRQSYNAKHHPDVKAGKKTEDEILYEFLDTFEAHHSDNKDDARDGRVSVDEWTEYYNNVSMSIDRDDYFELMMNNAWNLKGDKVTKKGWGGEI